MSKHNFVLNFFKYNYHNFIFYDLLIDMKNYVIDIPKPLFDRSFCYVYFRSE